MDSWKAHLQRRLAPLSLSAAREAEIIEELSQHLDERYAELRAGGANDADARRLALEELLDQDALANQMRSLRQARVAPPPAPRGPNRILLHDFWQDVRHTARRLRNQPGFTAAAILTLAFGIGATTAIFSVVNAVLINPLPYPDSDRLVSIVHSIDGEDEAYFSEKIYTTYLENNRTFDGSGIWDPYSGSATITGLGEPEEVRVLTISQGLLATLGVRPEIGRGFSSAETLPGSPDTVILTNAYWQQTFGGDPRVLGRSLTIDSRPHQIIGVMPPGFRFGGNVVNVTMMAWAPDIIRPLKINPARPLPIFQDLGVARLKPGVTLAQANADIARMIGIWNAKPAGLFKNAKYGPSLRPLKQDVVGDVGKTLWVLLGTIGIVLLMACANVANLLLVRADARGAEFAIRAALGARWIRVARVFLVESLMLALVGGALGVGFAYGALRLLVLAGPPNLPRISEISIDAVTLVFAFGVSLLSGLLFGLIPILRYARPRLAAVVGASGQWASLTRERQRSQHVLVAVQMALAVVLLVSSGLMIRSFQALRNVEPGFSDPHRVQAFDIAIPPTEIAEPERLLRTQHDILEKIAAIPDVESVAYTTRVPMDTSGRTSFPWMPEDRAEGGRTPPSRQMRALTPGVFQTLGTPLIVGRDFTWTDVYEAREVVLISENLAREWWGSAAVALGKRIREGNAGPWREIIGVARDIHDAGVDQRPPKTIYMPARSRAVAFPTVSRRVSFIIRSDRAGTEGLLNQVREAVWSINRNLPLAQVRTLGDLYDQSMARTSFTLVMLAVAATMALLLGIFGIYGVISYAVSLRRREIGIRVALGAQTPEIRRLFMRRGLIVAGAGLAIGLVGAAGSTRVMQSLLFGVNPLDPITFAAMPIVLAAAAMLGSYLPARHAMRVDPLIALRHE